MKPLFASIFKYGPLNVRTQGPLTDFAGSGRSKNAAFKKLNEDLAKAQKTIRSQSDQTAGAKERRKANITPQRSGTEGPFS